MIYIYTKSCAHYSLMAAVNANSVSEANRILKRDIIQKFGNIGGKRVWRDAKRRIVLYSDRRLETGQDEHLDSTETLIPNPRHIER